jgi:drug/metabolite transporter (DMT)-like permease
VEAARRPEPAAQAAPEAPPPQLVGTRTRERAPAWQVWTGLWIVYVVWGSTYLAIRVADRTMPALLTSGTRFLLAGTIVFAVVTLRLGRHAVRDSITWTQLGSCALVGSLLVTGGNGLVMVSEEHVPSGVAALVIASVPLWVVVFRRATGDRVALGTLLGVALGFAGVALLFLPGGSGGSAGFGAFAAVLLAGPCWALGSFLSPRLTLPANPFLSTSIQMLAGGVTSVVAGLARGESGSVDLSGISGDSLLAFGYLVVAGSLIAFTAYVWLLQHAPISKVATYAYVNPVIAVFLGWLILGEKVTVTILMGALLIVLSVSTIVRKESG